MQRAVSPILRVGKQAFPRPKACSSGHHVKKGGVLGLYWPLRRYIGLLADIDDARSKALLHISEATLTEHGTCSIVELGFPFFPF